MQRISFGDNFILTQMDKPVPYEKCELFLTRDAVTKGKRRA